MKVLLVDAGFGKYPNLALMKFSTYEKRKGSDVVLFDGSNSAQSDKIYFATLFTYNSHNTFDIIDYVQSVNPNADLHIGGVLATLMPKLVEEKTGLKPHIGLRKDIDELPPDYDLYKDHKYGDSSYLFTTRGCPNSCGFCAIKTLEPESYIMTNWKRSINLELPRVTCYDNNLTAQPMGHFQEVMEYLAYLEKPVEFDDGFDVRIMSDKHIEYISKVNWENSGLCIAFDNMSQDGHFQRVAQKLIDAGISKSKVMVYALFNFKDTIEEANYRCKEILRFGFRPYPMLYYPLELTEKKIVVGKHWTLDDVLNFRNFWLMGGLFRQIDYFDFKKQGKHRIYEFKVRKKEEDTLL